MLIHVGLDRLLVQLLVECRVLRVHKDLVVSKSDTICIIIVPDNVELDLIVAAAG